jgi:hypothetical protein
MSEQKSDLTTDQAFIVFVRLAMGWTFLWAVSIILATTSSSWAF